MFESLSDKLQGVFSRLGRKGRLTEKDVDDALREVRVALLEADVNFKVVKSLVGRVRERSVGTQVLESLTPAQQVIKIVNDELVEVLGNSVEKLAVSRTPPTILMLVGLQGSGKTTTAAKLALHLRKQGQRPLLVAADPYRLAAVQQLITLGKQIDIPVFTDDSKSPPDLAHAAVRHAQAMGFSHVVVDTAGRLHVDDAMMAELEEVRQRISPHEVLLVADAMTGQDAVRVAEEFNRRLALTGIILTKLDGDARGGAALSIRSVTGVPIKFAGVGEKLDALEPFYPDRIASRILGMGDVLSLIERAQSTIDQEQARRLEKKFRQATYDFEDFLEQFQQIKSMGPLQQLLEMVPGMSRLMRGSQFPELDERRVRQMEAIILSMTPEERRHPDIIGGSRKRRIARGSGTSPAQVNQLLNQFKLVRETMKSVASGKRPRGLPGFPIDL